MSSPLSFIHLLSKLATTRVVGTDDRSNLVCVEDNAVYVLVDVTVALAADNAMVQLFRQPKSHIMVTGYVEELEVSGVKSRSSSV